MSFSNRTLDRKVLIDFVETTDKQILYTFGLAYRHPTIYKKPITKAEAVSIIEKESLLDAKEYADYIHLNAFSSNDMW